MTTRKFGMPGSAAVVIKVFAVALAVFAVVLVGAAGCHHRHRDHGERMREFADWRIEKMLKKVDATPEQKEGVMAEVEGLVTDLTSMHEDRGDMHDVLEAQLTAETIDRSALEALRVEKMEKFDVASRRVVDAVASIGEILSREQRLELAEEARNHHGHRGWGRN